MEAELGRGEFLHRGRSSTLSPPSKTGTLQQGGAARKGRLSLSPKRLGGEVQEPKGLGGGLRFFIGEGGGERRRA